LVEAIATITHPSGLHARPAALFVQTASRFASAITVEANGRKANAKSLLAVLSLGAAPGTAVRICAEGEDAEEAVAALLELVRSGFGEGGHADRGGRDGAVGPGHG
jgi:phosphocarrier protein